MRRRAFFFGLACVPASLLGQETQHIPENDFSSTYNSWVDARKKAATQGGICGTEIRVWKEVKEAWSKLKSHIDQAYNG